MSSLANEVAFKLRERSQDVEKELASRRGGIDTVYTKCSMWLAHEQLFPIKDVMGYNSLDYQLTIENARANSLAFLCR